MLSVDCETPLVSVVVGRKGGQKGVAGVNVLDRIVFAEFLIDRHISVQHSLLSPVNVLISCQIEEEKSVRSLILASNIRGVQTDRAVGMSNSRGSTMLKSGPSPSNVGPASAMCADGFAFLIAASTAFTF